VLVSVASIWEMALKHRRGRWPEVAVIVADPGAQIAAEGMTPMTITLEHARAAGLLDWSHRDPFDRMLAAQAIVEGALLVTADRVFASLPRSLPLVTLWE
jgi:PIN domain nuclease of toxin-antitoxin system